MASETRTWKFSAEVTGEGFSNEKFSAEVTGEGFSNEKFSLYLAIVGG